MSTVEARLAVLGQLNFFFAVIRRTFYGQQICSKSSSLKMKWVLNKLRTNIEISFRWERKSGLFFNLGRWDLSGRLTWLCCQATQCFTPSPYALIISIPQTRHFTNVGWDDLPQIVSGHQTKPWHGFRANIQQCTFKQQHSEDTYGNYWLLSWTPRDIPEQTAPLKRSYMHTHAQAKAKPVKSLSSLSKLETLKKSFAELKTWRLNQIFEFIRY